MGGEWPEPIALADLRGLLQANLSLPGDGGPPQPRLVAPPGRRILQYMAHLARPRLLALRGVDEVLYYDRKLGTADLFGPDGEPRDATAEEIEARFEFLIHWWEALALQEAANGGAG